MLKNSIEFLQRFLVPILILPFAKLLGLTIAINIEGLRYTPLDLLGRIEVLPTYVSYEQIKSINSMSDFIMYFIVFIFSSGFLIYYIRFTKLIWLQVDKFYIKFRSFPLLALAYLTFNTYSRLTGWIICLLITNLLLLINFLSGYSDVWVVILASIVTIILNFLLLVDLNTELKDVSNISRN
jgi:hypothetical protein